MSQGVARVGSPCARDEEQTHAISADTVTMVRKFAIVSSLFPASSI
jgi:hypothetical protein